MKQCVKTFDEEFQPKFSFGRIFTPKNLLFELDLTEYTCFVYSDDCFCCMQCVHFIALIIIVHMFIYC